MEGNRRAQDQQPQSRVHQQIRQPFTLASVPSRRWSRAAWLCGIAGLVVMLSSAAVADADRTLAGKVDPAFQTSWASSQPTALLLSPEGKLILQGSAGLVRVDMQGTLDPTFHPSLAPDWVSWFAGDVLRPFLQIKALVWDAQGKLLVGGTFAGANGLTNHCVVRLNPDGTADPTFLPNGGVSGVPGGVGFSFVSEIGIQGNGQILIGGFFTQVNQMTAPYVARLNPDGSIDSSFVLPFAPPPERGYGIKAAQLPHGKLLLALEGTEPGGLSRLNADGTLDENFNPRLRDAGVDKLITALAVTPDGHILVGGTFTKIDGQEHHGLARLLPNGEVDPTFDSGPGSDGVLDQLAVQRDGKLLVAGRFKTIGGVTRPVLARFQTDGRIDMSFDAAIVPSIWTSSLAALEVQEDGRIVLSGDFNEVGGWPRRSLVRLYGDPVIPLPVGGLAGAQLHFLVSTAAGTRYGLEYTDSLDRPNWIGLPSILGDGSLQILTDDSARSSQKFYRLRVEPPPLAQP